MHGAEIDKSPTYDEFLAAYGFTAEKAEAISLLIPGVLERRFDAFRKQTRFVHYTSAEVAVSIIRNRCVWLRNASAMNDYMELQHGIRCVRKFFHKDSETGKQFWNRLDSLHENIGDEIRTIWDSWLDDLSRNTYLISLSEHTSSENEIGRLSMWRAYGAKDGVAIIINPRAFHSASDALEAYSHPVMYFRDEEIESVFSGIISRVCSTEALSGFTRQEIIGGVLHMLEVYSIGLKHPGFEEEREWRVVYRPSTASKNRIPSSVQTIRGMPQIIHCLPLQDIPEEGLTGLAPADIIDTIIIGPSSFPHITQQAIISELAQAGVANPQLKVVVSNIPLRT